MKKIQTNTIYQCSFCDFQDTSAKIVGRHEYECRKNHLVDMEEKTRREIKAKLYECETMDELNTQLISYIKEYYKSITYKYSNEDIRFKLIKQNNSYIFSCKYAYYIQDVLGIKTIISDYQKIYEKLSKLQKLETKNKEQNLLFNKTKEETISKCIYNSKEYKDDENKLNELLLQKQTIEKTIETISKSLQQKVNIFSDEFLKTYKFENYLEEIKSLEKDLSLKS